MINDVQKATVGKLLSADALSVFTIPRYQREYTWGSKDWTNLFDDLYENERGYFLGSTIVIHKRHDVDTGIAYYELIDGQQRFTTISILLMSLYHLLNQYKDESEDDEVELELANLRKRLVLKKPKGALRVVPQNQGFNLDDYKSLLSEYVSPTVVTQKVKKAGNRKMYHAFRFFTKRLEQLIEHEENHFEVLFSFYNKVTEAVIVQIVVSSASDAYILFESLNNRGVPLSAVDLIKNTLLANFPSEDDDELDLQFTRWCNFLASLGDDYKTQERFFRQAYDAFRRELNAPFITGAAQYPLGATATKSNLLSIYEAQIKRDAEGTLSWLIENGELYSKIVNPEFHDELSIDVCESFQSLSRIQGVPSYLLILFILRKQDKIGVDDALLTEINSLLVRFFVRRNLTDQPPTRDLTRLFISITEDIEDKSHYGQDVYQAIYERLNAVSASDEYFERMLSGAIYDINPDATRYILTTLAEPSVTKEMAGLWDKNSSNVYVWTIEHIFPQGKSIPQEWVDMIADGDSQRARELQDEYVHTLGNLTLTGYNTTLGNKSFVDKRDRRDQKGNFVGYKNGLNLNADLADKDSWNCSDIKDRTKKLAELAIEIFKL